jgi:sulfur-oxidizing protein SoxX
VRSGATFALMMLALAVGGAARTPDDGERAGTDAARPDLGRVIDSSFRPRGQAGMDRLQQSPMQRLCSREQPDRLPADQRQRLQRDALAAVRYPEDNRWLGDWQRGEKIAQSATGLQYSDPPDAPHGGSCYGCHRLSGAEIAYGTIGPSLYHYLERNGRSQDPVRRTWARIWNAHAFNACSMMPRFGDAAILTPEQIRDVMALLFDPQSPVNR